MFSDISDDKLLSATQLVESDDALKNNIRIYDISHFPAMTDEEIIQRTVLHRRHEETRRHGLLADNVVSYYSCKSSYIYKVLHFLPT